MHQGGALYQFPRKRVELISERSSPARFSAKRPAFLILNFELEILNYGRKYF